MNNRIVWFVIFMTWGCDTPVNERASCDECPADNICMVLSGRDSTRVSCIATCQNDEECTGGMLCAPSFLNSHNKYCQPLAAVGGNCGFGVCPAGSACTRLTWTNEPICLDVCEEPGTFSCSGEVLCQPRINPHTSSACDAGICQPEAEPSIQGTCPSGHKGFAEYCEDMSECVSNICFGHEWAIIPFCSIPCENHEDCEAVCMDDECPNAEQLACDFSTSSCVPVWALQL